MAYTTARSVTIDNTKVSGSGDLTNFPMLFSGTYDGTDGEPDLRITGSGGDIQNEDTSGGASAGASVPADFIFSSTDNLDGSGILDFEIVYWAKTTGQIVAYVEIPTLDFNDDTVIYIIYNDSGVTTTQEDVAGTWIAAYKGVWHLAEYSDASGAVTRYDSTTNGNDLTDNNTTASGTGKIFRGADFVAANSEFLSKTDTASLSITGDLSIIFWQALDILPSTVGDQVVPVSKYLAANPKFEHRVRMLNTDKFRHWFASDATDGVPAAWATSDAVVFTGGDEGTFFHFAFSLDVSGQAYVLYKNGSSIASAGGTFGGTPTAIGDGTASFVLGASDEGAANFIDGILEEVRLYSGIIDADWVATEYENQNSPSTFYAVESGGAATALQDVIGSGIIPFER
ncbi:MAG: hypothetical protein DRP09_10915 [Candidatus Thorarchaeota archaeon]|nr:MAG: hypothetical protein DRP09_10915 [Candidatus Thorarchaeota archaeon]